MNRGLQTYYQLLGGLRSQGGGIDVDAEAYLTAVDIANDSTLYTIGNVRQFTGSEIYAAFSECFAGMKSDETYDLHYAMYFPIWGTAAKNKWNAINPIDSEAAYRLTYEGTILHSNTGMKPGLGVNNLCRTYLSPVSLPQFSNHATVFQRENVTEIYGDRYAIISTGFVFIDVYSDTDFYCGNKGVYPSGTVPNIKGLLTTSRTANNNTKIYRNGSVVTTNTSTVTAVNPASPFLLLFTPQIATIREEISFASIGLGITDAQETSRNSRITTLLTYFNIPII